MANDISLIFELTFCTLHVAVELKSHLMSLGLHLESDSFEVSLPLGRCGPSHWALFGHVPWTLDGPLLGPLKSPILGPHNFTDLLAPGEPYPEAPRALGISK